MVTLDMATELDGNGETEKGEEHPGREVAEADSDRQLQKNQSSDVTQESRPPLGSQTHNGRSLPGSLVVVHLVEVGTEEDNTGTQTNKASGHQKGNGMIH